MNEIEQTIIKTEEVIASEELSARLDKQISWLEEEPEQDKKRNKYEKTSSAPYIYEKQRRTKRSLTGKYYQTLLRKEPIKWLLIIGGIFGCIISAVLISRMCGGNMTYWFQNWWWIPLSTFIIGPIGLVFFALILPFIPWILYGILYAVVISIGS